MALNAAATMKKAENGALTATERLVLALMAEGFSNKEIAERQFVSLDTVKKHLFNAYRKLGARNKIEALRNAGIL